MLGRVEMNRLTRILNTLSKQLRVRLTIRELMALDDDSLKDIGLSRSTIAYHVKHGRIGVRRH
jgi:uncharacterized protein YjiS (DUF1127 family)